MNIKLRNHLIHFTPPQIKHAFSTILFLNVRQKNLYLDFIYNLYSSNKKTAPNFLGAVFKITAVLIF
jgi:hypothetical protein